MRRGLTLIELLLALLITSMVALAVASIVQAGVYGTSSRRDVRRLVVQAEELRTRLNDAIRQAQAVLACGQAVSGEKYIVLWTGDTNTTGNDQVSLSELQLIEWTPGTQRLASYQVATAPNPDTTYPPATNFYNAADQARDTGVLVGRVWAEHVSAFEITLDAKQPAQARMATWDLTLSNDQLSEPLVATVVLRAHRAPE